MTNHRAARLRELGMQVVRFGLVGAAGFAVDIVVFNALRLTLLAPENIETGPLIAKLISTTLAIVTNWVGNRFWTFADSRQASTIREGSEFFAVSIAGMGFGLGSLWVSHYVLGFTSVLADNISSNVIGLALGAVFRFSLYRWWVFSPKRAAAKHPVSTSQGAIAQNAVAENTGAENTVADNVHAQHPATASSRTAPQRTASPSAATQHTATSSAAAQSTDVSSSRREPAA